MVLALSDEGSELVGPYVDELGITVRVAAGSKGNEAFKVKGYPSAAVIDAKGNLAWFGHPGALSNGIVEDALKGAKPRPSNFLAFTPATAAEGRAVAQLKSIEQGKLGKAHAALTALAADDKATDAEKSGAAALVVEIDGHVGALLQQAERFTKSRDVQKSVLIYDGLAKEFGAAKHGADAKAKAEEIRKDATLSKELAAAEAFEKTRGSVAKLGTTKAREKWKEFAEKYKGTRAGERAMAVARPAKK